MALVTALMTLRFDQVRRNESSDHNFAKSLAVFCVGLLNFVMSLSSLSAFSDDCFSHLPTDITLPGDGTPAQMTWKLGPGFWCVTIATLLKVVHIAVHVVVPTPSHCHSSTIVDNLNESLVKERGALTNPFTKPDIGDSVELGSRVSAVAPAAAEL